MEFSLNGAELSLNSVNSESLRNHWGMNWVQYKDLLCCLWLCGWVVESLSVTQEILGSNPKIFLFYFNFFLSLNSANSVKAFRENSTGHEPTNRLKMTTKEHVKSNEWTKRVQKLQSSWEKPHEAYCWQYNLFLGVGGGGIPVLDGGHRYWMGVPQFQLSSTPRMDMGLETGVPPRRDKRPESRKVTGDLTGLKLPTPPIPCGQTESN